MATNQAPERPHRPALTLQIGTTGHRTLPNADGAALQAHATTLFRDAAAAVARLHAVDQASPAPVFAASPPLLRCLCGLAPGADTILAEAAIAQGWALTAVLPFARLEYERDFAAADVPRFQTLLHQATIVAELPGDRTRGGEPYADIGRQIVEQSDILLAIWDGLPPRGPGGTGDVVQQAQDRGIPVAVIPAAGAASLAWQDTPPGGDFIDAIVATAVLPPADHSGFPQAYYDEIVAPAPWAATAVRWFERAVLAGAPRPPVQPPPPTAADPAAAPASLLADAPEHQVEAAFAVADRLAGRYAARYRAAGLMRYGLVIPATLGSFIGNFGPDWAAPFGYALQFASLIAVLAFSARSSWSRDQRRFIAYRALAEYLRNARLLMLLGASIAPPRVPAHQERVADWAWWYGRGILRQAGLPGRFSDAAVVARARHAIRAAAWDEIAFLRGRASRFSALARRLRLIGISLTIIGFALVAIHAAMVFVGAGPGVIDMLNELALVLPAMAPVFLGLLEFGEYGRLSTRYAAVAAELEAGVTALDRAAPSRGGVLSVARRITDVMLAEGADWQLLIKARTMSAF